MYFRGGPYPATWNGLRAFGPTGNRFDHHTYPKQVQARAVLYAAQRGPTCLAEVFQRTGVIDTVTHEPWIVRFGLAQPLRLLSLRGTWPTQAGASMAINNGSHHRARAWSRAIYAAYPDVQGLWYCSSMDANRACLALYERGAAAVPATPDVHLALADPRLRVALQRSAAQFNYGLLLPTT